MKRNKVWIVVLGLAMAAPVYAGPVNVVSALVRAGAYSASVSKLPAELAARFKGIGRFNRIDLPAGEVYQQLGERAPHLRAEFVRELNRVFDQAGKAEVRGISSGTPGYHHTNGQIYEIDQILGKYRGMMSGKAVSDTRVKALLPSEASAGISHEAPNQAGKAL